jgi:hypothetical protein
VSVNKHMSLTAAWATGSRGNRTGATTAASQRRPQRRHRYRVAAHRGGS